MPTDSEMTPWWSYPDQVAALYLFLVHADRLDPSDSRAVAYALARPWKYEAERAEMLSRRVANDADPKPSKLSLVQARR